MRAGRPLTGAGSEYAGREANQSEEVFISQVFTGEMGRGERGSLGVVVSRGGGKPVCPEGADGGRKIGLKGSVPQFASPLRGWEKLFSRTGQTSRMVQRGGPGGCGRREKVGLRGLEVALWNCAGACLQIIFSKRGELIRVANQRGRAGRCGERRGSWRCWNCSERCGLTEERGSTGGRTRAGFAR